MKEAGYYLLITKMDEVKEYFEKLYEGLQKIDTKLVYEAVDVLYDAWRTDKKIFIIGNGGSASTASHMACDFGKGTLNNYYNPNQKRLRVISLTDNVATMTAFSNDLEYEDIFAQQLNNLIDEGDIVISISASGNSKNVIKAVKVAKRFKATNIGFLGFDGGKLKDLVDIPLIFEEKHYGRSEDAHMIFDHLIAGILFKKINKEE